MHKILPIFLLGCFIGCGSGGGDDTITDSRTCITSINNNPIVNVEQALAEAEEIAELDVESVVDEVSEVPLISPPDPFPGQVTPTQPVSQVAICGTNADVDAVISNPQGREALAAFLAAGVRTAEGPSDAEEVL